MNFKRTITIYPGYDRRASGEGVHAAEIVFILQAEHGAITFAVQTDWIPKSAAEDRNAKSPSRMLDFGVNPKPLDTVFHFDKPLYTAHQQEHTVCPYIPNNISCYSVRRNELSESFRDVIISRGSDKLWEALIVCYKEMARMNGVSI